MSNQDIRLRLVIRRHAVPEVKLVWPCTASDDVTVSKLLTQINEVVPLESGEWGLEDYAVELCDGHGGSFECLHFQQIARILKHDDQVIIRSLLSDDLKKRRLSGRHQISTDGKHLVDGIAFGRPWLRAPRDRPVLSLPPRKRARIAYQADEDLNEDEAQQLLLEGPATAEDDGAKDVAVSAWFDDADDDSDDDEDDEDFRSAEDDSDEGSDDDVVADMAQELQLLKRDNALGGHDPNAKLLDLQEDSDEANGPESSSRRIGDALSLDDKATIVHKAYPLTSPITVQVEMHRCGGDIEKTYNALALSNDPVLKMFDILEQARRAENEALGKSLWESDPSENADDPVFEAFNGPKRPLIVEVESQDEPATNLLEHDSDDTDTSSSTSSFNTDTDDDDSESDLEGSDDDDASSDDDTNGDAEAPEEADSEIGSARRSASPTDDAEDDTATSFFERIAMMMVSAGKTRQEIPLSSSSDEMEPENEDMSEGGSDVSSEVVTSDSDSESDSSSEPEEMPSKMVQSQTGKKDDASAGASNPTTPGQGLSRTKKRNARRREFKRLQRLDAQGTPAHDSSTAKDQDAEFLARKEALLKSLSDGASEVTKGRDGPEEEVSQSADISMGDQTAPAQIALQEAVSAQQQSADFPAQQETTETPQTDDGKSQTESAKRRSRIDLGAGRRLVFGALGLKNPKTKADAEKVKKDLMKDVRPLQNLRREEPSHNGTGVVIDDHIDDANPDWWREKINYSAVECCHDDVELSEPPFPFQQRWDPQQQYRSSKKRKRQQYEQYEPEEEYTAEGDYDVGEEEVNDEEDPVELNNDNAAFQSRNGADSQATDVDDLPSLPDDITTLPELGVENIKEGMVIAWKELQVSKATNWQPIVAQVSGLVAPGGTDTQARIILAKRNRRQRKVKRFDPISGKRIYDKFEAPSDDEDYDEDEGYRDVSWDTIMEPRLVQQEPPQSMLQNSGGDGGQLLNGAQTRADVSERTTNDDNEKGDPFHRGAEGLPGGTGEGAMVEATEEEEGREDPRGKSQGSVSIQSGQGVAPTSGGDGFVSLSTDSWDVEKPQSYRGQEADSPSYQLEETSQEVDGSPGDQSGQGKDRYEKEAEVAEEVDDGPEMESDLIEFGISDIDMEDAKSVTPPDNIEGRNPDAALSATESGAVPLSATEAYPQMSMPSIESGRQPQTGDELADNPSNQFDHDSVIPETLLLANPAMATPDQTKVSPTSSQNSSPFPSLDEVFLTAATQRQTQSPIKAAQESASQGRKRANADQDTEYEEAMRKMDEGMESDDAADKKEATTIRSLFPHTTQPVPSMDPPSLSSPNEQKARRSTRRQTKTKRASLFKMPPGSQVIALSSSPASAKIVETYADDTVDGTYGEGEGVLPRGPGWVSKKRRTSTGGGGSGGGGAGKSLTAELRPGPAAGLTGLKRKGSVRR